MKTTRTIALALVACAAGTANAADGEADVDALTLGVLFLLGSN